MSRLDEILDDFVLRLPDEPLTRYMKLDDGEKRRLKKAIQGYYDQKLLTALEAREEEG